MGDSAEGQAALNLQLLERYQAERLGPRAELLRRVKATYRRSARDVHFNELLEHCIRTLVPRTASGDRDEAHGIVVLGESGAGKSTMVRVDVGRNEFLRTAVASGSPFAAVGVRCLGSYTLRVLAMEIIRATGYPVCSLRENAAWIAVRDRLHHLGVMVLCVDEVNNVINSANTAELKRIINNFKALLNHPNWPVVLILTGTPGCEGRLRQDEELRRRMHWMNVDPLRPSDAPTVAAHLRTVCATAELSVPDHIVAEVVPRLVHAARAQLGSAISILTEAIELALLKDQRTLVMEHFARSYGLRTQADAGSNPFVADNWAAIVPVPVAESDDDASWNLAAAEAAKSRATIGLS